MASEVILALPPRTATHLDDLCEHANKQLGISMPKDFERFCKFVIIAHEENVQLPEEALCAYFEEHGWSHDPADAIAKRYKAAGVLLNMYDRFRDGSLKL